MIDDHEEYEEHDIDIDTDYYDRPTIKMHRSTDQHEESYGTGQRNEQYSVGAGSRQQSVSSSYTHRTTVEHVIGNGCGDVMQRSHLMKQMDSPILEKTPKRQNALSAKSSVPSLDLNKLDQNLKTNGQNMVAGFVTSTPQVQKGTHGTTNANYISKKTIPEELSKYFGHEESIRASPMTRRERRGTQTIVLPTFDSPASDRKFKAPMGPPPPVPGKTQVKSPSSLVKFVPLSYRN